MCSFPGLSRQPVGQAARRVRSQTLKESAIAVGGSAMPWHTTGMMPIVSAPLPIWRYAVREGYRWWQPLEDGSVRLRKDDGTLLELDRATVEALPGAH